MSEKSTPPTKPDAPRGITSHKVPETSNVKTHEWRLILVTEYFSGSWVAGYVAQSPRHVLRFLGQLDPLC